jgi:dolichol-phosphate mannosyltransferase
VNRIEIRDGKREIAAFQPEKEESDHQTNITLAPFRHNRRLISIVIPMYREEKNIANLIQALDFAVESEPNYFWEYILVNDGSPDNTMDVLEYFSKHHARCKVVDLSRNFGKEIALTAGLRYTSGDAVICLDADLQHPPKYIPEFLRLWEKGFDIISALRKRTEKQTLFRKLTSHLYYWIMNRFTDLDMASQTTDFRLLDRKVVNAMEEIGERQRIFRGLIDWLGFKKTSIEFEAPLRGAGDASYSLNKLLSLAVDSFVSHSTLPLKLIGMVGFAVSASSSILLAWMLSVRFIKGDEEMFTPLAFFTVGNTLLFGTVISMLGLLSLYIKKIYGETINRPLFVVRSQLGFEKNNADSAIAAHSSMSNELI